MKIHLYGLLIGLGVWIALEVALAQKKIEETKRVEKVFPWLLLGGLVGARLYHVIDFWTRYYSINPLKIFFVWEGGLGIWGAILGGMVALYFYSLVMKIKFWLTLDTLIVGVPLAQAIGRLGNWVNGELYGKNGESLFAYEAILNLVLFAILWKISRKSTKAGRLSGTYFLGYGLIRIILEGLRPQEIIWRLGNVPTAVLFGIISILMGLWLIFVPKRLE